MNKIEIFEWLDKTDYGHGYARYIFFSQRKHFLSIDFNGSVRLDNWPYPVKDSYWRKVKNPEELKARYL